MIVYNVIADYPGLSNLKETTIRRVCIDRVVNADAVYEASLKRLTDLCIADCLIALVNLPDFKESDLSETLSRESIEKSANSIYSKYGDANDSQPSITGRNVW